jgi:prepilin-type N-terminal cleavage/methylation domain-containing protein
MHSGRSGFTLIELSIVLVIIGLIVGGVLVGQDLIKAAEVRATISQIEKYNTAVNTFYGKYQALPGDMNISTATTFGFNATTHNGTGSSGRGDGNGVIDGGGGGLTCTVGGVTQQSCTNVTAYGETGVFWVDLSSDVAGHLIDGNFSLATEASAIPVANSLLPQYLPAVKLGRGNYFYVTEINKTNYFGIEDVSALSTNQPYIAGNASLTVAQAYSIDNKIDDGYPTTGTVAAMVSYSTPQWVLGGAQTSYSAYIPSGVLFSGTVGTAGDTPSSLTCFDAAAGTQPTYSLEQNGGNGPNCALIIRFQ